MFKNAMNTDIDCYVHFIVTSRFQIFFYEPCNFDKKFTKMNAMSDFERHNTGGHSQPEKNHTQELRVAIKYRLSW